MRVELVEQTGGRGVGIHKQVPRADSNREQFVRINP